MAMYLNPGYENFRRTLNLIKIVTEDIKKVRIWSYVIQEQ